MEQGEMGPRPVRSVTRAFALLEELGRHPAEARLSDLAAACGLSRSTTHNLLATLEHLGYTTQTGSAGRYRLTEQLAELARESGSDDQALHAQLHPLVAELARETGETCYLAVASWKDAVYLDAVESVQPLRVGAVSGTHCPLLGTAIGHVLLAGRPATARRMRASDPSAWQVWEEAITKAGQCGYALDVEQHEPNLCCVAVPVPTVGIAQAALCLAGPAHRLPRPRLCDLAQHMRDRLDQTATV